MTLLLQPDTPEDAAVLLVASWSVCWHLDTLQQGESPPKKEAVTLRGWQMYAYGSLFQLFLSTQGEMSHYNIYRIKHYSEGLLLGLQLTVW